MKAEVSEENPIETTDDTLLDGTVIIRQPKYGFRAAIDSVLLPAAINAVSGERVLEIGAGCGAASLCLARRLAGIRISGIEIQPHLVRLAGENIRKNGLEGQVDIMLGDVDKPLPPRLQGPFDHVMLNPPYLREANSRSSPNTEKTVANVEGDVPLELWLRSAYGLLRHKGYVTLIHRADRLDDIMFALGRNFGGVTVFPLWPKNGVSAKRVIVRARKGVATPLRLTAGLVLHAENGDFTEMAAAALRGGALEV